MAAVYSTFVDGSFKTFHTSHNLISTKKSNQPRKITGQKVVRGAFAVVSVTGDPYSDQTSIVHTMSGVLVTDPFSPFYLPFQKIDNYTSEMIAAAEAVLHILQTPRALLSHQLYLYCDNESVVKSIKGEYNGDSNKDLYIEIRRWITILNTRRTSSDLPFLKIIHINSHAKEKGIIHSLENTPFRFNDIADKLAVEACDNDKFCNSGRFSIKDRGVKYHL